MKVLCACGCGEKKEKLDARGRETRFIFGHGNRGRKFPTIKHSKQFKKGSIPHNKGIEGYTNAGTFKVGHKGLFKGNGRHVSTQGYWNISVNGERKLEHRHIMELHIGRKLTRNEHVHHINHDKLDNRIENLEITDPVTHGRESANTRWNLTKGVNYVV